MADKFRRGGGDHSGRDRADTNYGAFRPREAMSGNERKWLTETKLTDSKQREQIVNRTSGGAGSSSKSEATSGNPVPQTYQPTKFWSDSASVSGLDPTHILDDVRTTFDLLFTPLSNSVEVFYNGNRLVEGKDFTVSSNIITWIRVTPPAPPAIGLLSGFYWYDTETS